MSILTKAERVVFEHIIQGKTTAEIAKTLYVNPKTVRTHIGNVGQKTGTHTAITTLVRLIRDGELTVM